ncbi:hypothetical protein GCM10009748_23130 [Agromyces lapidis]
MVARKNLRAVEDDEKAIPTKSVSQAAATGDHRSLLVAMRERIARAVSDPECPPRDLASLTRRLQDISKEIGAIDLRAKEAGADAADVAADEDWSAEAL